MACIQHIFVVAECFGHGFGGDGKLSFLMAKEFRALEYEVSAFCVYATDSDVKFCKCKGINVELGKWRRGCRWKLPEWRLSRQIINAAQRMPNVVIFKLGITYLTRILLNSPINSILVINETTQASPNNKFVDKEALNKLGRCMAVTTPSETVEHNVRQVYNYQGTIIRLPHWIDPNDLGVVDSQEFKEKIESDFLYLGRLDPEKGLFELMKAFGDLVTEYPRATLTICGTGNVLPLKKAAMEAGCEGQIDFTYTDNPRKIGEVIQACKWMILPSYHEGYPLSPLEAFACSRPAILTKVGSIPEMCHYSLAAILIQPKDVEALHNAMVQALEEPQVKYVERCIAAKQLFSKISNPEIVRENFNHFIEELEKIMLNSTLSKGTIHSSLV